MKKCFQPKVDYSKITGLIILNDQIKTHNLNRVNSNYSSGSNLSSVEILVYLMTVAIQAVLANASFTKRCTLKWKWNDPHMVGYHVRLIKPFECWFLLSSSAKFDFLFKIGNRPLTIMQEEIQLRYKPKPDVTICGLW